MVVSWRLMGDRMWAVSAASVLILYMEIYIGNNETKLLLLLVKILDHLLSAWGPNM